MAAAVRAVGADKSVAPGLNNWIRPAGLEYDCFGLVIVVSVYSESIRLELVWILPAIANFHIPPPQAGGSCGYEVFIVDRPGNSGEKRAKNETG